MRNASALEFVVVLLALVGAGYSFVGVSDALLDHDLQRWSQRDGDAALLARQTLRNEAIRFGMLIGFTAIGITSLFLPNTPGTFSAPRLVLAVVFFGMEISLVYASYADRKDSHVLQNPRGKEIVQ